MEAIDPAHPGGKVRDLALAPDGTPWAAGEDGVAYWRDGRWVVIDTEPANVVMVDRDGTAWVNRTGSACDLWTLRSNGTTWVPTPIPACPRNLPSGAAGHPRDCRRRPRSPVGRGRRLRRRCPGAVGRGSLGDVRRLGRRAEERRRRGPRDLGGRRRVDRLPAIGSGRQRVCPLRRDGVEGRSTRPATWSSHPTARCGPQPTAAPPTTTAQRVDLPVSARLEPGAASRWRRMGRCSRWARTASAASLWRFPAPAP